jgi:hypothetical protein
VGSFWVSFKLQAFRRPHALELTATIDYRPLTIDSAVSCVLLAVSFRSVRAHCSFRAILPHPIFAGVPRYQNGIVFILTKVTK